MTRIGSTRKTISTHGKLARKKLSGTIEWCMKIEPQVEKKEQAPTTVTHRMLQTTLSVDEYKLVPRVCGSERNLNDVIFILFYQHSILSV